MRESDYRVVEERIDSGIVYGGHLHVIESQGAYIDPDGVGSIWRLEDFAGGLSVTRGTRNSESEIEADGVTTCCVIAATDRRGRKSVTHPGIPIDVDPLFGFALDNLGQVDEVHIYSRMPADVQRTYADAAARTLARRGRTSRIIQKIPPQPLDLRPSRSYSVRV